MSPDTWKHGMAPRIYHPHQLRWCAIGPPLTEEMYFTSSSYSSYEESYVLPEEVLHLIRGLDVKKANGPDGVSAYMLKASAESIAYSLAKLFSLSLSTGRFPILWKSARVVPIPKSGNKTDASNYRPISLLSVVSKLLEKYVYSLLWTHLLENAPLSTNQWGFQKGKSTVTSLLAATQNILDQRGNVMCVFFDFSKAFDMVPHQRLMTRLSELKIHPCLLSWICSYLSNRRQHVGKSSFSLDVFLKALFWDHFSF